MKLAHLFESANIGIYQFNLGTPGSGDNTSDEYYQADLPASIGYIKLGHAAAYTAADYHELWEFVKNDKRTEWMVNKVNARVFYSASWTGISDFSRLPTIIEADFQCRGNDKITSLKDVHKYVKQINADGKGQGLFDVSMCDVKSHVLGVFNIKGVKSVLFSHWSEKKYDDVTEIVNRHLKSGDVFECQDELIGAGYSEYAQL